MGGGLVSTNPSEDQVQAVRQTAARIADGVKTGLEITRAAGRFIDTLPLSNEVKNDFDRSIVAVTGTSDAPGPLVAGLQALGTVSAEPELKATVTAILISVQPLITKLTSHENAGIAGFGAALQAAIAFAQVWAMTGGLV